MSGSRETRYARGPQGHAIAFQVCGGGDIDLVYVPNWASPIDLIWDHPSSARFLARLASFSRLVLFDKRGSGSSDHVSVDELAALEDWTDDIVAVMDTVGSKRAVLLGVSVGGPIAMLFAATHPERTSSLVLVNSSARSLEDDGGYPGLPIDGLDERLMAFQAAWGTEAIVEVLAASMVSDQEFSRWFTRFCRVGNPPTMATAAHRAQQLADVRHVLPAIHAPTLVVQREGATGIGSRAQGQYLAEQIRGARYVELAGTDIMPFVGDSAAVLDEVEQFVTGDRPLASADRVLATVLFTDIVGSTGHADRMGDRGWTELLNEHDVLVSRELERHRGRKVNPTGDGVFATFDGPARAVRCAQAITSGVRPLGIEVRAGLNTGEVETRGDDVSGIAVHIGQRISGLARPGEVLVSRTVIDLVTGSGLKFDDRGEHQLKGVPGTWHLYSVLA